MHYEDIKFKQSTYAIISFNDWARLSWRFGTQGALHRAGVGGSGRGWLAATTLDIRLSLLCPDLPRSHFIKGINFSNVHNCEP